MDDVKEPVAEVVPETVAAEVEKVEAGSGFVGGEVHIIADPKTGQISVNAPVNMVIALGLLETAKSIIISNNARNIAEAQARALARPAIVPASAGTIKSIDARMRAAGIRP